MTDPSPLGQRRLVAQRISHSTVTDPAEVIAWLGAIQGQDYSGAKWSIGLRLPGSTEAQIEQAIVTGQVMRTWAVRGTLHFVAPADIHWIVGLIAPRQIAANAGRYRELELDEATLRRSTTLIADAVQDGKLYSRPELLAMLETFQISTAGQRGVYMLQRAGLERLIYQGPLLRNVTTFMRLPDGQPLSADEALIELARRYFRSRGPATVADFAQWSDFPLTAARHAVENLRGELIEEQIGDQSYWLAPDQALEPAKPVYLLPGFDEYLLGYKDRTAVLDPLFADAVCPGGNGIFMSTIVSEGRIVGTWKREIKRKHVEVNVKPFQPLTEREVTALAEAFQDYGRFIGLPVQMR